MKKLITALSVAATAIFSFGAGAEFEESGTSFEELTSGDALDTTKEDDGEGTSDRYWYATSNDGLVVTNYDSASASTPIAMRPDQFADENNVNYLSLDTSTKLYRTAKVNSQTEVFDTVEIPDDGIYLDTLVQFTAADTAFASDLDSGEKIAISYVEHGEDAIETEGEATYTNFVIRAGYITGAQTVVQTNYFAAVPANFDKAAWHRLTVRTVGNIDSDAHVGFVVYVDQVSLEFDTSVAIGDNFAATGVAQIFYKNDKHALFPSAVVTGGKKLTIEAAAFTGMGAIDDISFTTTTPAFISASEVVPATIALGTGITGVTVKVGSGASEETILPVDDTADPLVYNLPAGTTQFTLVPTADTANGYVFDGIDGATYTAGVVTWEGLAPTFTVLAARNNFLVIDGQSETPYRTLAAALAAAGDGDTIKLAYNYTVEDYEEIPENEAMYEITGNIVLDLNGNTLDGGGSDENEMFYVSGSGSLTVIDSSAANTGKIVYTGSYGVFDFGGSALYIGAVSGDYGPTIDGVLFVEGDEGDIVRAKVKAEGNTTDEDAFSWAEYVVAGSDYVLNQAGTYWIVEPEGGDEPTTFALTVTVAEHATATVALNGGTAEAYSAAIDVGAGTNVPVAATPASGYTYTGVTLGTGWTLDNGAAVYTIAAMSEAVTLAVPAPAEVTYAITYTGAANATVVTVPADTSALTAGTTVTFTATPDSNYTYTGVTLGDWTLDSNTGAITYTLTVAGAEAVTVPDAVSAGGKTYPSYISGDTEKGKYDTWAENAEISAADFPDAAGANEEAYLLNCAPADVAAAKAAFKFTKIEQNASGEWETTTTTSYANGYGTYNGTVSVTRYSDPACTTASESGQFFKATLSAAEQSAPVTNVDGGDTGIGFGGGGAGGGR